MVYRETVTIEKDVLDRVNALLDIAELEKCTRTQKLLNPKTDDYIGLASVKFKNGNFITIDVCSGTENYYDNCVLKNKDGYEVTCFDCDYFIGKEIEFVYKDDTYIVTILTE